MIKKRSKLYRRFTTFYVRRSTKSEYEGSRSLQCFIVVVLLKVYVEYSLDGKLDCSKPLYSKSPLAVSPLLQFAAHSYLKKFSEKTYDSRKPYGMACLKLQRRESSSNDHGDGLKTC